ncbi:MAG: peptidoglycan DD-metalloendopeptidase family protein [Oscillospiraceae bacterium]|nr:peptidoglycan DD-metalloendopeptidase family protein [Oscillospiraceae bacterium]
MKLKKVFTLALALIMMLTIAIPASAAGSVVDENSGWYWPTVNKTITSGFGIIRSDGAYHQGIDIRAAEGTDVYAARPGTVYRSGWNDSMGNYISIYHGTNAAGKHIFSTYMHLSQRLVSAGQTVEGGKVIGKSGNTGSSSAPHLHFHVFRSTTSSPSSVSPSRPNKATLDANYVDVGKINYNGGSQPAASTLNISVTSYPVRIQTGSSWGMRGSVTSNYNITRVEGYVYNSAGYPVMTSLDYPNAPSMDIRYSQVNNALCFNKLSADRYTLMIFAVDDSGKTQTWSTTFEVYDKSTLSINMTSTPTSIAKGKCFGLRGTISSNYMLTGVQAQILNSSGAQVDSTWDSPTGFTFNVRYGNINNYLEFNWLDRGSYTLRITAHDASGNTVTYSKGFTVY